MTNNSKRIAVTGAQGQLGRCLQRISADFPYDYLFLDRSNMDISSAESINNALADFKPDLLINAAAYTAVDKAEEEQEQALTINRDGVSNLKAYCERNNVQLIQISTDYVFDGNNSRPYKTEHPTNPKTVYGRSKESAEKLLTDSDLEQYLIIRTSWLYSEFGTNFYKTILNLARTRDELRVVNDQLGSPTNANDLAHFILSAVAKISQDTSGIYHFSNTGEASWFDFAKAIISRHNLQTKIVPVSTEEFPTAAKRPAYSVMDTSKTEDVFDYSIRSWEEALF